MKIKLYEQFVNENIFKSLENAVKGRSNRGAIISDMLKKGDIKPEGFLYTFHFKGGSEQMKKETLSHPISYLFNQDTKLGKVVDNKLVIQDELKQKMVPNIIPLVDSDNKDGVEEHGKIWSSAVEKFNYKFDLSKDVPTLTLSDGLIYSIETGQWTPSEHDEDKVLQLDGEVTGEDETELVNYFTGSKANVDLMMTYEAFVEEVNKRPDIIKILAKHHSEAPATETTETTA